MRGRPTSVRPGPRAPIGWGSVSKPGGGTRSLVRLDANDDRAYSRAVSRVVPLIDRARGPTAIANRVARVDPTGFVLSPWGPARRRCDRAKDRLLSGSRAVAVTDVRDCYASIAPDIAVARLLALGAPTDTVRAIAGWLRAFEEEGIRGLPVGPVASAILADAVLAAGDLALRQAGWRHLRWVDDVAIFTDGRRAAASALDALRAAWTPLGLELHPGKTCILDPDGADVRLDGTSTSGPRALR